MGRGATSFGYMPKEVADGARLYGVELDNLTGRIAAKLYPQANVQIKGFEDTTFPNDKFDIVVGNVPFGGYGVADSDYNRYNFKVHDYFLAKSVDKVKPGGIVAIVTSKGTMDQTQRELRGKYVRQSVLNFWGQSDFRTPLSSRRQERKQWRTFCFFVSVKKR